MKEKLNHSQGIVKVLLWLSVPISLVLSATALVPRIASVGWTVPWRVSIVWTVAVTAFEFFRSYYERDTSLVKDCRLIGTFFSYTYFITLLLLGTGLLSTSEHPSSFWHARVEFFFTWGIFLAITGAFYAIFAKRRADAVFDKSEEILRNITSFFTEYEQIMGDGERAIPALISKSERCLTILLGSPLVAYFRKDALGTRFFTCLLTKLNDVNLPSGFKIDFLCWNHDDCMTYVDQTGVSKDDFIRKREILFQAIKERGGQVRYFKKGIDPGYRCIIADGEAIFWLLADPTPGGANDERQAKWIQGGGFNTDRNEMINILTTLFLATVEKDSEPASIIADDVTILPATTATTELSVAASKPD
jgi:hypothetical protein